MTYNPKGNEEKIRRSIDGWERIASAKSFGGMTLDGFKAATDSSLSIRHEIEQTEAYLQSLYTNRDRADETSLAKIQLLVNGVLADPEFGPDSALYEALGYVRKSDRHSGLTRKHEQPPEK